MRKIVRIGVLLMAMLGVAAIGQAQKFGYVNSAAILSEMPDVKQADSALEALQKQLQKKGQDLVTKLQQDYAAVQQKIERGELSPKQQEEEGKRLEDQRTALGQYEQDMQKQLQEKRNTLLEPIYDKVNTAIKDVAKENGYTMIFDQGVLLYAEETADVTKLVKTKLGITGTASNN